MNCSTLAIGQTTTELGRVKEATAQNLDEVMPRMATQSAAQTKTYDEQIRLTDLACSTTSAPLRDGLEETTSRVRDDVAHEQRRPVRVDGRYLGYAGQGTDGGSRAGVVGAARCKDGGSGHAARRGPAT